MGKFSLDKIIIILLGIILLFLIFKKTTIKSNKLINPEIRLIIENGKVDTIYIYKK